MPWRPVLVSATAKDPRFVESGRDGARKRWGPPRVLRLDELPAAQRRIILAIVDVFRAEADKPAAGQE